MRRKLYRSIPGRLVGLYLALMIASLCGITLMFHYTALGLVSSSVEAHLQAITEIKSELITRWMTEREHDIALLARKAEVIDQVSSAAPPGTADARPARRALGSLLRLVRDQYGTYHDLYVVDREAQVVASSAGELDAGELDDPGLLEAVRLGKPYTASMPRRTKQGLLSLAIASPLETAHGQLFGAVVGAVDLDAVRDITEARSFPTSGEAYLVDERGVFVTHRDQRRVLVDDISSVAGVAAAIAGRTGVGRYRDYRGVPVVGAFRWLPRWRWGLVAEVDEAEAFAPIYAARRNLWVVTGLLCVAAFLATLLVVRRMVRPLRQLTHAVQAVAAGKLDQRLAVAGDDDVAYLTECFNEMARSLNEAQSVMDRNIRVATADLEKKNAELGAINEHLAKINEELQRTNHEVEQQRALVERSARFAAMGEMAAGIAHEINNPLTTMRNLVHSLRSSVPKNDVRHKDVGIVAHEIDKINRLVQSFLRYAQPPQAHVEPVLLDELVTHALGLLEPQARQKELTFRQSLADDVPAVMADREQLGQVLVNLLLNAIQSSPAGREIRVFTRAVFAAGASTPSKVEIGVSDRGPGIAPEHRDKVFSPFFTTKADGCGLGLAISERILEQHGGELGFTSSPDEGTTFVVSLPGPQEPHDEPHPDR